MEGEGIGGKRAKKSQGNDTRPLGWLEMMNITREIPKSDSEIQRETKWYEEGERTLIIHGLH